MGGKNVGSYVPLMRSKDLVIHTPYRGRSESCGTYLAEVRTAVVYDLVEMMNTAASMADAMLACKHNGSQKNPKLLPSSHQNLRITHTLL